MSALKRIVEAIKALTVKGKYEKFKKQLERTDPSQFSEHRIPINIEGEVKKQAKELAKKYGLPPGVVYRALLRLGPQLEDLLSTLQRRGVSKKDVIAMLEAVGEGKPLEQLRL